MPDLGNILGAAFALAGLAAVLCGGLRTMRQAGREHERRLLEMGRREREWFARTNELLGQIRDARAADAEDAAPEEPHTPATLRTLLGAPTDGARAARFTAEGGWRDGD